MRIQNLESRRTKRAVRQKRENHQRNHGELHRRDNIFRRKPVCKVVQLLLGIEQQQENDHSHARFQQPIVPAQPAKKVNKQQSDTCRYTGRFFLMAQAKCDMRCRQQNSDDDKACNERSHRAQQIRKEHRQNTAQTDHRERANTRRMPIRRIEIRMLTLHANNKTDTQRSDKLIKNMELNHACKSIQKTRKTSIPEPFSRTGRT